MQTALGTEPIYTNYTQQFKGTLDYVLFSPMRIRLMSVAGLPTPNEIEIDSGEGLPSSVYPSDHLMLVADVALSITGSGNIMTNSHRSGYRSNKTGITGSGMMLPGTTKRAGMR